MKIIKIAGILVAMSVLFVGCASGENQFSPEQVINNALEGTTEMGAYYGESEMKTSENGQDMEHLLMKEWVSEDGKRRVETMDRNTGKTSIAVNDGNNLTSYEPEAKQAFVIEDNPELLSMSQLSPKQQAEQLLKTIQETHEISAGGEEEVAGRETYHLIAKAKEDNALMGDQELWIDKENWMVLKMNSSSGDIQTEMTYTKVEIDPEIPADTFTLDLPDDAKVQDMEDMNNTQEVTLNEAADSIGKAFLHFPETEELSISNVELLEIGGELQRNEVNINYQKDGLPYFTMTVFESPEQTEGEMETLSGEETVMIRGIEGTYTEMNEFRSLVWQEEGLTYSIILTDPNLTLDTFKALTEDMVPVE